MNPQPSKMRDPIDKTERQMRKVFAEMTSPRWRRQIKTAKNEVSLWRVVEKVWVLHGQYSILLEKRASEAFVGVLIPDEVSPLDYAPPTPFNAESFLEGQERQVDHDMEPANQALRRTLDLAIDRAKHLRKRRLPWHGSEAAARRRSSLSEVIQHIKVIMP